MALPDLKSRQIARAVGLLVFLMGVIVLLGWALDIDRLKTVFPGLVTMKVNTAIGLSLGGLSQLLLSFRPVSKVRRAVVMVLSAIVGILGALILSEYLFKWNPHIDEMFFRDTVPSVGTSAPGRTSPSTAFCLVLIGIGLEAACRSSLPRFRIPLLAALGTSLLLIGAIGCIGQSVDVLFGFITWNYFGMAFHTAGGMALLGIGFIALSRMEGRIPWLLDKRIAAGFAGSVAILLVAAGCSWNYTHQLEDVSLGVSQAHEVLRQIEEIRADRATAEGDQRGFIILGDEKMLADRTQIRDEVLADLASIRKLTAPNAEQQGMLDQIAALMTQRREVAEQILDARRQHGFAAAQQMLASGPSLGLGSQITDLLAALRESEVKQLALSERNVKTTSTATFLLLPVAMFLSLTLLALALFFLNQRMEEQSRAEEKIRTLNATLEQRVAERTVELEATNKELEAFSYSISHDLRAPLRAVDGYSQAVLEDFAAHLPPDGVRRLKTIRAGAQRMGLLIDDLLSFSRLSRAPLSEGIVPMDQLARLTLAEMQPELEGRHLEVRQEKLLSCRGDDALLKQVWVNLISNAVKYTRRCDKAVIEIGCKPGERNTYFIRDNGAGFDMRYAGKLFGVFQRFHRADEFEGTGVGLAIAQRIVQRHGGTIWAEAELNRGATFSFTLREAPGAKS